MEKLLAKLRVLKIDIDVNGDELILNIPEEANIGNLLDEIRTNKYALIEEIKRQRLLRTKRKEILPTPKGISYRLSAAQKRMYFLNLLDSYSLSYNMMQAIHIGGLLDKERVKTTFTALLSRHESLRTCFSLVDGVPMQRVLESVDFSVEEFKAAKEDLPVVTSAFVRPFDLSMAPLLRVGLVHLGPDECLLMIDMHHIVSDGVSKDLLIGDFMSIYQGLSLPLQNIHYRDYAEWQYDGQELIYRDSHRGFWLSQFSDPPDLLELPCDYPRPAVLQPAGGHVHFRLSEQERAFLVSLSERESCSMFMVLLSVYVLLLSKLGNQDDIVVGTPVAGRDHADLEGIVGMFVNTLALRNHVDPRLGYLDFLRTIRSRTLDCFDHQSFPYEELVEELGVERNSSRNPLFDVMFSYRNFEEQVFEIPGLKLDHYEPGGISSKFDLTLSAGDSGDGLLLTFEYATSLYREETILRFSRYFHSVISAISENPDVPLRSINLLSGEEVYEQLESFNATDKSYAADETVVSIFDRHALLSPTSRAVIFRDGEQDYGTLKDTSDRIGTYLINQLGLLPGQLIGLMVDRNLDLIAVILGIMKAGCAYVPIDPSYPSNRKDSIITDSGMSLLITGDTAFPSGWPYAEISLADLLSGARNLTGPLCAPRAKGTELAYVIYTSGSTGKPKGVMIEHHSVVNRLQWMQDKYKLNDSDVLLQKTPLVFDVSVWELFWWMFSGSSLCILEPGGEKDPTLLSSTIARHGISVVHFVPSMLSVYLSSLGHNFDYHAVKGLRLVFSSGEALRTDQVTLFGHTLNRNCGTDLINLYGPTEATVDVSYYQCSFDEGQGGIPIGRPIDNIRLYVLGKQHELLPVGVRGELGISGAGLARGYLNNPEMTGIRFISHPFVAGEKLYLTGDLVKWLPDGMVSYIGRIDEQVKLRGFRIELGEIEYHLGNFEGVGQCYVLLRENNGGQYLVAYYTAVTKVPDAALSAHLLAYLPHYMVPSHFVHLDQFPVTTNGKLDRKKLPEPVIGNEGVINKPKNQIQKDLIAIWSEVLDCNPEQIGINSSFFDLGGSSLKLIKMTTMVNACFSTQLTIAEMFRYPTIFQISEQLNVSNSPYLPAQTDDDLAQMTEAISIFNKMEN